MEQKIKELRVELSEKDDLLNNTFSQLKQLRVTLRSYNEQIESLTKERDQWRARACENVEGIESLVKNSEFYNDLLDKYNALREISNSNLKKSKIKGGCQDCEILTVENERLKRLLQEKEKDLLSLSEIPKCIYFCFITLIFNQITY